MAVLTAVFASCGFQTSLGGQDVPENDRRYLLIPVSGCVNDLVPNERVILDQLAIDDFGDENGWPEGAMPIVAHLGVGESVCQNDGIAQEQIVVRIR